MSSPIPTAVRAVPTRSRSGRRGAWDSGISRAAPIAAIRPRGRLMKKISRQVEPNALAAIRAPPMIGPSTAERPMTGPNKASADPRSAGAKMSRMIPRPWGISSAAAAPCASRRRRDEAGGADHEQALAAVDVTEPSAGQQSDGERAQPDPRAWREQLHQMMGDLRAVLVSHRDDALA